MKKMFKRMTALCISIFIFASSAVFAAESGIVIKREENDAKEIVQKVIVTGEADIHTDGDRITLKIFPSGKNEMDMELKDYALFDEIFVNPDGTFSFEKIFSGEPGDYKVIVTSPSGVLSSSEIYFPALDSIQKLIEDLNHKTITAAEAAARVESDNKNLVFDAEIFDLLSSSAKTKVFENMMTEISSFDINNIYESFDRYTLLNALNSAENTGSVQKALEHYEKNYLKLKDMTVYKLFDSLNSNRKNEVYSFMEKRGFKSFSEVKDGFFEAVILTAYKNVPSYLSLYDILKDYQTELNCTSQLTALEGNSTTKNGVLRYLIAEKNKVNTVESLISKLDYAIENIDEILKNQSTESGNTGNRGNGGSSTIKTDPPSNSDKPVIDIQTGFTDLGSVKWAEDAIMTLYEKNIIKGKTNSLFAPEDSITRAEFVKMLTAGLEIYDESAVCGFSDAKNHWAYGYIASAYSKGYIMGQSDELFGVDSAITREDTAVILYRILQVNANAAKVTNPEANYSDMDEISDYAVRSVRMLSEYGVIKGFEDNTFKPGNPLTRAEAAVLVNNFLPLMNR